MARGMQWDKARKAQRVRERGADSIPLHRPKPKAKPKPRGISNDQARELGRLQRALGERYTGAGMTADQATRAILTARARLRP